MVVSCVTSLFGEIILTIETVAVGGYICAIFGWSLHLGGAGGSSSCLYAIKAVLACSLEMLNVNFRAYC
jgi:hypothetical protein